MLNNDLVDMLKLTFEMVDPRLAMNHWFFNGSFFTVDPRTLPDQHWSPVSTQSEPTEQSRASMLDQYQQLREWEIGGTEPIRNVRIFSAPEPQWTELSEEELLSLIRPEA